MLNRPESSVSVGKNEYGELIFSCDDNGPVIHRTPEELGIPRVIPDVSVSRRFAPRPDYVEEKRVSGRPTRGVKKDAPVKSAGVRMNATATERKSRMTNATVVAGGGRANNRVPSKRYGMPAVSVVEMDEVPEPCHRDAGIAGPLYAQIAELKDGALKVDFETEGHASYVLTKLRRIAKKEDVNLLSSKSADGKTRWFWLEKL